METGNDPDHHNPAVAGITASHDVVHAPRGVIGDRGAGWIVEGWDLFRQAWTGWLTLALAAVCWLLVIDQLPILQTVNLLLDPFWTAGFLLAAQANYQRQPVKPTFLLAGFRRNFGRLLIARLIVLGLALLIASLLLGGAVLKIASSESLQSLIRQLSLTTDYTSQAFINNVMQLDAALDLTNLLVRILLILLLVFPLVAAGWFAPALIVLGNCDIKTALWYSLQSTMKNLWSFAIYGLLLLIMALLEILPWHVGYLLLIPLFYLSMYLSYRDIFLS